MNCTTRDWDAVDLMILVLWLALANALNIASSCPCFMSWRLFEMCMWVEYLGMVGSGYIPRRLVMSIDYSFEGSGSGKGR
jgi:hypothetical protein